MTRKLQTIVTTDDADENCAPLGAVTLRDVDNFDFRSCEVEWLYIFRTMLSRPDGPSSDAWVELRGRAERQFGDQAAPLILGATVGLIRAIKAERPHPFFFVSPECAHCRDRLCEDEFLVMCAVVASRCGDGEQLHLAVNRLTQAGGGDRLLQSIQSLATVMNMASLADNTLQLKAVAPRVLH